MASIYSTDDGHAPPLSHLQTWALGFQIQDHRVIEDKVLPLMKRKMDRLDASEYETFYEDEPEGFGNANLLSREKCLAWVQSIADHLMDSEESDEKEIVLYEFSDRPEGFPNPQIPEVIENWKHATVAMFSSGARTEGRQSGPKRLAAKLPPASPAGVSKPGGQDDAVIDDNAGPSRPPTSPKRDTNHVIAMKDIKDLKIAGIRAALQYNGYPSDVIEDLLENHLQMWKKGTKNSFNFKMKLPNGKAATSYGEIDANPYPDGKITELLARKCHVSGNCSRPFGHTGGCKITPSKFRGRLGSKETALAVAKADATQTPSAGVDDGAGPSMRKDSAENRNADSSTEALLHHATVGVRTGLLYAGYPIEIVDEIMKNKFHIVAYPDSKFNKYGWSIRLPNGKRVTRKGQIQANPYPGGAVSANPICHTLGCRKEFGHHGICTVPHADRYKIKREAEIDPVSPSPVKKRSRAASPSPLPSHPPESSQKKTYLDLSPQQLAEAISRKKDSLRRVLNQARYPSPVTEQLLDKCSFQSNGVDKNGNILINFQMRLPNGSYASNDESILLNPYSLAGGGFFGGSYTLQGSRSIQKKLVQKEDKLEKEASILSSSSDDEEEENEGNEDSDKEDEERPGAEGPISLLTTEEEDNIDEGEDEYSSLED